MKNITYTNRGVNGTRQLPCTVLGVEKGLYKIKYKDKDKEITELVHKSTLVFPSFTELVI